MKLGLIGNGAIAKLINSHCVKNQNNFIILGALGLTSDIESVGQYPLLKNIDELIDLEPDIIIECASSDAVKSYSKYILSKGVDLIIISVGALSDEILYKELLLLSNKYSSKFFIPTGALAGLDAIEAAKIDGLESVLLKTTKPPNSWQGAPGVNNINLDNIKVPKILFTGNAREAANFFPKNANVAAALAIYGVGMDNTSVQLIADPNISINNHRVIAKGSFGELDISIKAVPSADNPKTSKLAALSVIKQLNDLNY